MTAPQVARFYVSHPPAWAGREPRVVRVMVPEDVHAVGGTRLHDDEAGAAAELQQERRARETDRETF